MFGSTELSAMLGAPPVYPYETPVIKKYARTLAKAGLHVLLCAPESKVPVDMRTKKQREEDEANGLDRAGMYLATNDTRRLDGYITRYRKDPPKRPSKVNPAGYGDNARVTMAVHLGPSRLVVIDADTPNEVAAVQTYWGEREGIDPAYVPAPTVATPGQVDDNGNQVHHGGRHWYFRLPDDMELPAGVSSGINIKVDGVGQFTIKSGNSYVLIPPSYRNNKEYRLIAPDVELPLWVRIELDKHANDNANYDEVKAQRAEDEAEQQAKHTNQVDLFNQSVNPIEKTNPFAPANEPTNEAMEDEALEDDATADELEDDAVDYPGDTLDERLESWSAVTPWDDILHPHGWVKPGMIESCGCDIWTRPIGDLYPSTPKSAVTHDETCDRDRTDKAHPAMHIWSDHVGGAIQDMIDDLGGRRTLSKLDIYAALEHDGDRYAALDHLGIKGELQTTGLMLPAPNRAGDVGEPLESAATNRRVTDEPEQLAAPVAGNTPDYADNFVMPTTPLIRSREVLTPYGVDVLAAWGIESPAVDEEVDWRKGLPPVGNFDQFRNIPPVKWSVDGLLERGGLTSVIGDSGAGKSAVVLDMACAMASGIGSWYGLECDSHPVIYIAGEGVSGAVERVKAWERANGATVGDRLWVIPESVALTGNKLSWAYISHLARGIGAGMIILDTFARMSGELEENSATDMSRAVGVLDKVKTTTGAGVLVVHHTTRGTRHGRGSTALIGAMDSELLLTAIGDEDEPAHDNHGDPVKGKAVTLSVSKQKNGRDDQVVDLVLTEEIDVVPMEEYDADLKTSLVVTDINGRPARFNATYLQDEPTKTFAPAKGETVPDTAARVLEFVESFDELESTITDIKHGVMPDAARKDSAKAWGTQVRRAIDHLIYTGRLWRVGRSSSRFTATPPLDE